MFFLHLLCDSFLSHHLPWSKTKKALSEQVYKHWFPLAITMFCIHSQSGRKKKITEVLINKGGYNQQERAVDCVIDKSLLLFCLISSHHTTQPGEVRWNVNKVLLSEIILHHGIRFQDLVLCSVDMPCFSLHNFSRAIPACSERAITGQLLPDHCGGLFFFLCLRSLR